MAAFLAEYRIASEELLCGNLKAAAWFPEGCYPPAYPFVGPPPPRRPLSPPTRAITVLESGAVERGEIPVVEPTAQHCGEATELRCRGRPP